MQILANLNNLLQGQNSTKYKKDRKHRIGVSFEIGTMITLDFYLTIVYLIAKHSQTIISVKRIMH